MEESKPILAYWNYRGLANPIRLMLAYLEVDYEEKSYDCFKVAGIKEWEKVKTTLDLDFPNLPYWADKSSDVSITESRAIIKHIIRTRGNPNGILMPDSEKLVTIAETVEGFLFDFAYLLSKRCVYDMEPFKSDLETLAPIKMAWIEKFLENKTWLFGDKLYYVDFCLYEALYLYNVYDPEILKPYPALLQFKTNFESIPKIKQYIESPDYIKYTKPIMHPFFSRYKI